MTKFYFVVSIIVLLQSVIVGKTFSEQTKSSAKPFNLLFIMTDQHRYDVLGCAGNSVVKTPNLDALAADGVRFTSAYTPCPVCTPARTSILTGRSIYSTGIDRNILTKQSPENLPIWNQISFDDILNKKGYFSEYHGKWHSPISLAGIKKTADKSFYHHFGYYLFKDDGTFRYGNKEGDSLTELIHQNAPIDLNELKNGVQYNQRFSRPYVPVKADVKYGKPSPTSLSRKSNNKNNNDTENDTDNNIANNAVEIGQLILNANYSQTSFQRNLVLEALDNAFASAQPFNITASFSFPHPPYLVTEPYFSIYRANNEPIKEFDKLISPSIDDRSPDSPYALQSSQRGMRHYFHDRAKITDAMSVYYALVTEVDDAIGKLIQKLKENDEYNNTLIIYTSDHGEMLGAHGRNGKGVFFEESIRVPLIIKLPENVHKGLVIDKPVTTTDLFATILDYTIVDTTTLSEGKSLRRLIENPDTNDWKDYAVIEWSHKHDNVPSYCVVTKEWKLMLARSNRAKNALYDLKNDPNELVNLLSEVNSNTSKKEQYRETINRLKNNLLEWMNQNGHSDKELIRNIDVFSTSATK
ncbi:MAG: sulfatase-like hydrolase/transferase [Planctomycetaceae bacterium]|jgi:arylsulfatase A-like enzyme|nr:sulfatase-like hydrolase/transferase [Planctomycetaceae bacterium]